MRLSYLYSTLLDVFLFTGRNLSDNRLVKSLINKSSSSKNDSEHEEFERELVNDKEQELGGKFIMYISMSIIINVK